MTVCAGFHISGVPFVGIDMHGKFETGIDPHQHITEGQFPIPREANADEGFVPDAVTKGVFRTHMNVPQRANNTAIDPYAPGGALQRAAWGPRDISTFPDRRMDTQFELLRHSDFNLRVFARGSEDAHTFHATFRSNNSELFFTRILSGLGKVRVFRELVSLPKQRLNVLLSQVNVMC